MKTSFWSDSKIVALSDDAKLLALYLLTGPHRNILGCMRIPEGYLLADLGWTHERLSDAIRMLSACHFLCRADDGWTLIVNQLKHDPLNVPNHVKAAVTLANQVPPETPIYRAFAEVFCTALDAIRMASAWHPLWHPDGKRIPEPEPEPRIPIQEKEQGYSEVVSLTARARG